MWKNRYVMNISPYNHLGQKTWPDFRHSLCIMKTWILTAFVALLSLTAQATNDWFDNLSEADREALEALVLYPSDVRQAILLAGTHPEILVRLERLQSESQSNFEGALQSLAKEDQEAIWNMTRYPGLLQEMNAGGRLSATELDQIASRYDADIQPTIVDQGQRNPSILRDVQNAMDQAERSFTDLLNPYPSDVQQAYSTLVGMPELLETLTSHLSLAVLVSDLYRQDPATVNQHLDQLAIEAADNQAQALQDWQTQLENDPQMRTELESAAAEFAQEEGWTEDQYTLPPAERTVEVRYVYEPYPYWFGYPWWNTYPRWYPYPWWYDWGFYYGPRGAIVVYGMPTYTFWGWYYGRPANHYYYPHLTAGCVTYYDAHRRTGVALNGPTREFIQRSGAVTGKDWLDKPGDRASKIRDYGKLEMDYEAQANATDRSKTRAEILRENPKKYSELTPPSASMPDPDRSATRPGGVTQPTDNSTVKPAGQPANQSANQSANSGVSRPADKPVFRPESPTSNPVKEPSVRPAPQPAPARSPGVKPGKAAPAPAVPDRGIERPTIKPTQTTRPEDFHKGTWSQPSVSPSRSTPPAPRTTPSAPSRPAPARTSPSKAAPAPAAKPAPSRSGSNPQSRASGTTKPSVSRSAPVKTNQSNSTRSVSSRGGQ